MSIDLEAGADAADVAFLVVSEVAIFGCVELHLQVQQCCAVPAAAA